MMLYNRKIICKQFDCYVTINVTYSTYMLEFVYDKYEFIFKGNDSL